MRTLASIVPLTIVLCFAVGCQDKTGLGARYSDAYVEENRGKVLVEIPEVFELANIAIAISDEGLKHPYRVRKRGAYYQRVLTHFQPFADHALIGEPDLHRNFTYTFRDNSVCYVFDGDEIVHAGGHPQMRQPNLFKKHLAQAQDFAKASGFRRFYRENRFFYEEQLRRYRQKVPIRRMWTWLEERFSARHDCYKVVFSPLIGESHETRSFQNNSFSETIMFVSGPGEGDDYAEAVGEALLARVVFTEIDHNYVNRLTERYRRRVKRAFAELDKWNQQGGYRRGEPTFNEYMTWAVFLLYAHDNYDAETFKTVNERVGNQMVHGRKFVRFKEFGDQLLELYLSRSQGPCIADLYPAILDWAEAR